MMLECRDLFVVSDVSKEKYGLNLIYTCFSQSSGIKTCQVVYCSGVC